MSIRLPRRTGTSERADSNVGQTPSSARDPPVALLRPTDYAANRRAVGCGSLAVLGSIPSLLQIRVPVQPLFVEPQQPARFFVTNLALAQRRLHIVPESLQQCARVE